MFNPRLTTYSLGQKLNGVDDDVAVGAGVGDLD